MWTVGAETRRVKFGRPPRRQKFGPGMDHALGYWRKWDHEQAPHVVIVANRYRRFTRVMMFEHRHFGPCLWKTQTIPQMIRIIEDYARTARTKVERQVRAEMYDVRAAMDHLERSGPVRGYGYGDQH